MVSFADCLAFSEQQQHKQSKDYDNQGEHSYGYWQEVSVSNRFL
jgi:hypothetical protein